MLVNSEDADADGLEVFAAVSYAKNGMVTWLTQDGRRVAAIVPVELAERALGAPGPEPVCGPCRDSRHHDCDDLHAKGKCGCDQRELHGRLLAGQATLYRRSRGAR